MNRRKEIGDGKMVINDICENCVIIQEDVDNHNAQSDCFSCLKLQVMTTAL